MWYLVLIIITGAGNQGLTSQQIPVRTKEECEAKMKVFDNTELSFNIDFRSVTNPMIRAICIEGSK